MKTRDSYIEIERKLLNSVFPLWSMTTKSFTVSSFQNCLKYRDPGTFLFDFWYSSHHHLMLLFLIYRRKTCNSIQFCDWPFNVSTPNLDVNRLGSKVWKLVLWNYVTNSSIKQLRLLSLSMWRRHERLTY